MALRTRGRFGIPRLLAAIEGSEVIRGGHSWLEREFLRLLAAAGLPRPMTQLVLAKAADRLVRVDCHFADANLVVACPLAVMSTMQAAVSAPIAV